MIDLIKEHLVPLQSVHYFKAKLKRILDDAQLSYKITGAK